MWIFRTICSMIGTPTVNSDIYTIYHLIVIAITACFAIYDYRHKIVPNKFLLCFISIALLHIPISIYDSNIFDVLLCSITGFCIGGGITLISSMVTNGGIGGGDIKFCAILGFIYGYHAIIFILSVSALLCAVSMLFIKITKRNTNSIAFIPYIFLATVLYRVML